MREINQQGQCKTKSWGLHVFGETSATCSEALNQDAPSSVVADENLRSVLVVTTRIRTRCRVFRDFQLPTFDGTNSHRGVNSQQQVEGLSLGMETFDETSW